MDGLSEDRAERKDSPTGTPLKTSVRDSWMANSGPERSVPAVPKDLREACRRENTNPRIGRFEDVLVSRDEDVGEAASESEQVIIRRVSTDLRDLVRVGKGKRGVLDREEEPAGLLLCEVAPHLWVREHPSKLRQENGTDDEVELPESP